MSRTDRNFTIFIMLFILGTLGLGEFYYQYEWMVLRFPSLVGFVICLFCVGKLVKGRRGSASSSSNGVPADGAVAERRLSYHEVWPTVIWVVSIVPVVFLLGYVIGLPLYVFAYLKAHGQGWRQSVVLSLCTLAVIYLGFVKALGVLLPVLPVGFP